LQTKQHVYSVCWMKAASV